MCYNVDKGGDEMTAKEIAEQAGVKLSRVYYIAKRLGKLPSVRDVILYSAKRGRPPKNFKKN